ncbi:MAG: hypothetical protein ACRDRS_16935 [Pseudonocardiaceae bacterium]
MVRYCGAPEVHPSRPKAQDWHPALDCHSDDRTLYLGDDQTGRALEVLTVPPEDGELVIHAMDLRAKYRSSYDAAKEATTE